MVSLGITLTLAAFIAVQQNECDKLARQFELDCTLRAQLIQETVHESTLTTYAVKAFFEGSEYVSPDEFAQFVSDILKRRSVGCFLGWIPRVRNEDREEFERRTSQELNVPFEITDAAPGENRVRAKTREEYYPLTYTSRTSHHRLGTDFSQDPTRWAAIRRARDSGEMTVTEPMQVDPATNPGTIGVVFYAPVYRGKETPNTPEERRKQFAGIISGGLFAQDVVASALKSTKPMGIPTSIADQTASEASKLVMSWTPRLRPVKTWFAPLYPNPPQYHTTIAVADRQWTLDATGNSAYVINHADLDHWVIIPAGFGLTLLGYLYLRGLLRQRERMRSILHANLEELSSYQANLENLVEIRTKELSKANDRLLTEIEAHRVDSDKLLISEERMRGVFNSVGVGVAFADLHGKACRYSNDAFQNMLGYSQEELANLPLSKVTPEPFLSLQKQYLQEMLEGRRDRARLEKQYVRKDGRTIWVDLSMSVVRGVDGKPQSYSTVVIDITDRKRVEEELKSANDLLQKEIQERADALEKLAVSEERFRGVFSNVSTPITFIDSDLRMNFSNEAFQKLVGYSAEELIGSPMEKLTPPEQFQKQLELMKTLVEGTAEYIRLEKQYVTKSGKLVWVDLNLSAVRHDDRSIRYYVGVINDISERKSAEEKLLNLNKRLLDEIDERRRTSDKLAFTEERMRGVFNTVGVGFAFASLIGDGGGIYTNLAFQQMVGYSAEELIDAPISTFTPEPYRSRQKELMRQMAAGEIDHCRLEKQYIRKDGQTIWVDLHMSAVHDAAGLPKHYAAVVIDITERKNAEEELLKANERLQKEINERQIASYKLAVSEERMRGVFGSVGVGIVFAELSGKMMYGNEAFQHMIGYSGEELEGMSISQITPEPFYSRQMELLREMADGKRDRVRVEKQYVRKDGERIWVDMNMSAVCDAEGTPRHYAAVIIEVTDRKKAEEELIQLNEQLKREMSERQETSDKLFKAEEYFKSLFNSVSFSIGFVDFDGKVVFVNDTAVEWLGYSKEEFQGMSMSQFTPRQYKEMQDPILQDLAEGKIERARLIKQYISKDGRILWGDVCMSAVRDAHGKPQYYAAVIIDVTEQKRVEDELRKLSQAVEQNPCTIVVTDRDGNIEYANPKFTETTGYSVEEALGQNPRLLKSGEMPDEDYSAMWKTISAGQTWQGVFHNKKKNGELYWESAMISPIRNADGEITHFIAVKEDITEKKRFQEDIASSEERYRLLAENISDVIWTVDVNGKFNYVSPSSLKLWGYTPEEILAMPEPHNVLMAPHAAEVIRNLRNRDLEDIRAGRTLVERQVELEHIRKDGSRIWGSVTCSGLYDRQGRALGILGTTRDVTERKKTEDALRRAGEKLQKANVELRKASEVKSQFLAAMSHEIRTPMNAVIGMTGVLLDTRLTPEQRDTTETIRTSGEMLLALINDILDFSKIEAERMELEKQPFDLRQCVDEAFDLISIQSQAKNLTTKALFEPNVPMQLVGDVTRLRQILVNLLGNSVKFTEKGGISLAVDAEELDPDVFSVHFSVKDTGVGIPPELVGRLFQAFSQVEASTNRRYGGTGLGLAISKRLCEMMGGKMWVVSSGVPGEGSVFHFTVIAHRAEEGAVRKEERKLPSAQPIASSPARRFLRILLAEDNLVNQKVAQKLLQKIGCRADVVSNGQEAYDAYVNVGYDVILMDCQMPEVDGYEAARMIRRYEEETGKRPVSIIAMTAHALQGDREKCLIAGMNDYLSKPVRQNELEESLSRSLQTVVEDAHQEELLDSEGTIMPQNDPVANMENVEPEDAFDRESLDAVASGDLEGARELIDMYLNQSRHILDSLREASQKNDAKQINQLAHKLAGSSAVCGLPIMVEPLRELEAKGAEENLVGSDELIERIEGNLNVSRKFLEQYLMDMEKEMNG